MSEDGGSMFVRQETQREETKFNGPGHLLKNKGQYTQIVREFTSDNPESSEDGKKVNGQSGVVVPVADRKGMIRGNPSLYGKVVIGNTIGADGTVPQPLDIKVLEDRVAIRKNSMTRSKEKQNQAAKTTAKVDLPNTVRELEEVLPKLEGHVLKLAVHKMQKLLQKEQAEEDGTEDFEKQAADFQEELDSLLDEEEEMLEMEDGLTQISQQEESTVQVTPALKLQGRPSEPAVTTQPLFGNPIRVKMDGSFGRSTTKFLAVERHNNQLILIYDPEENIFVPSSDGEPFNLNYNNQMLQVTNVGIEFDLDFLGVGVLVFVIMET